MDTKSQILNISINSIEKKKLIQSDPKGIIVTPNVDHLIKLQKDILFYKLYKEANYILCDSKIIFWISKFLNRPIKEQITGSDFFPDYCLYFSKFHNCKKIFLLGGSTKDGLNKAIYNINNKTKSDIIIGGYSPPFGFENDDKEICKILKIIKTSGANVLAIGLGAPKQEKFIFNYKDYLENIELYMAIGATIDFESGIVKRAPKFLQIIGLEWMFRMLLEPNRMLKRYLWDDFPIFYLIIKQKLKLYQDPFKNLF